MINHIEIFEILHKVVLNYLINYFDHIVCILCCSRVLQDQLGHLEKMVPVATQVQLALPVPVVTEGKAALP